MGEAVTFFSEVMNLAEDILFEAFGGTAAAVSYGQGATSIAIAEAWKGNVRRDPDPGSGIDKEFLKWRFRASDLSSLTPSPRDSVTEGVITWFVEEGGLESPGQGEFLSLETSRRVQRGAA